MSNLELRKVENNFELERLKVLLDQKNTELNKAVGKVPEGELKKIAEEVGDLINQIHFLDPEVDIQAKEMELNLEVKDLNRKLLNKQS